MRFFSVSSKQQMSGQLGLLNIACAAKAKSRRVTMVGCFVCYRLSGSAESQLL